MPDSPAPFSPTWRPRTVMTHGGLMRSQFMETCEALYLTSGYVYSKRRGSRARLRQ